MNQDLKNKIATKTLVKKMEDDGFTVVSTFKEKSNAKEIEVKAKKELKEYLKSTY